MNSTTKIKTKVNADQAINTQTGLDTVSTGSIVVMGVVSAVIGLWAVACFVGVMVSGGGPLELAQSWFSAITGM
ncbi:MAG: hypothetical protein KKB30_14840 [Proteobacteria bacterium]|nr:hypothetical protein [Pseudomonadota bacterium]MBU1715721.1 hypothetical protein [Pseudomonadota bacterium]